MIAEIYIKDGGAVRVAELDAIRLEDPSVVRLQLARDQVQGMERVGNDLVVTLKDGSQIRLTNFYKTGQEASVHDLVLQEGGDQMWLADHKNLGNFRELTNWAELVTVDDADGGGGAALMPILGGVGGLGLLAAAASGGGGGGDGPSTPPRDTTPPAAPLAALVVDSGTSATDKISNQGDVRVTNIELGARVEYQIDDGPWTLLTGDTFNLPEGTYEVVNIRQTDAAGNVSPVTNIGPITIDVTPPGTLEGELVEDTGPDSVAGSGTDQVTQNGAVTVEGVEADMLVDYRIGTGPWIAIVGSTFTLPEGIHENVVLRQRDTAGNETLTNLGRIEVDSSAPAAPTARLLNDNGPSNEDGVSNDGTVLVTGLEDNAIVERFIGNPGNPAELDDDANWELLTLDEDGQFILPVGEYEDVILRQVDLAGNASEPVRLGEIEIETEAPDQITAILVNDNGTSEEDGITNDGTIEVSGVEDGAVVQLFTGNPDDEEALADPNNWETVTLDEDDQFELPAGEYEDVLLRQVDQAGNASDPFSLGPITIDKTPPGPITAEIVNDNGPSDEDGVTNDGLIAVSGVEEDAIVERYTGDPDDEEALANPDNWVPVTLDEDNQFELPAGEYEELILRQVDLAGNPSVPFSLGPVEVETEAPDQITAILVNDNGTSEEDGITNDGTIFVSGVEVGAMVERYTGDPDDPDALANQDNWESVTLNEDSQFLLPPGEYEAVLLRQVDQAGNAGDYIDIGPITIDVAPPAVIGGALVNDNGPSNTDKITNDGTVNVPVEDAETGAIVQYRIGNGPWTEVVAGTFAVPEGTHQNILIRQMDVAGNYSPETNIGPITVDTLPPAPITAILENDNGTFDDDGITNDGTITVSGLETGAIVQRFIGDLSVPGATDDPANWQTEPLNPAGQFVLPADEYDDVLLRQVDLAGNPSSPVNIGPIDVIIAELDGIEAALLNDTGTSNSDQITNDGTLTIDGFDPDGEGTVQYSPDGGTTWLPLPINDDDEFELPAGEFDDVWVRQVDLAGNASEAFELGPVIIDVTPPVAISGALANDTGVVDDKITNDGTVNVGTPEEGGIVQYSIDDGTTWNDVTDGSFVLPENIYNSVLVRQRDLAGNDGPATEIGPINVDVSADAPIVTLAVDDGDENDDFISTNGKVNVSGVEVDAEVWVSVNNGPYELKPIVAGGFVLEPGIYTNVSVYQVDKAGNQSPSTVIDEIQILEPTGLTANDDVITLAMGDYSSVVTGPVTATDVDVIELFASTIVSETGQKFTVNGDQSGTLFISVSQQALVAVSAGFVVELYDSAGVLVANALTADSPLIGSALGLEVLNVVGDDSLTVTFKDLVPGDYYVVVRNDESTISDLVDNISLADIGQGDELLGSENRQFILDALRDALEAESYPLIDVVLTGVELALIGLSGTPLTNVVDELVDILNDLGVTTLADALVDSVVEAFVANALSLLQTTTIEGTLVEYDFDNESIEGNVFDNNGNGADAPIDDIEVVSIALDGNAASEQPIASASSATIIGNHGTLIINSDGTFTYTSFGHPSSVGQSDVFVYEISDGTDTSEATLTFTITGEVVTSDVIDAIDDSASLDMGAIIVNAGTPVTYSDINVLEVGPLEVSPLDSEVKVTVDAEHTGALEIKVIQENLIALANAYRLDIYDADGNVVYSAVTQNSLVGDVAGLNVLGLLGDEGLYAQVEGLTPGDYYVVVSNDSSALDQIVQGLELADLGQDGVLLGSDNQAIIVSALNDALGNNPLSELISGAVDGVLTVAQGLPLVTVLANIVDALTLLPGVGDGLIDDILDSISDALLSNALSLFETTVIETTLTEYDFTTEVANGNVLEGSGADVIVAGTTVQSVTNSDGKMVRLAADGTTSIEGEYGILTIDQSGEWTYKSFGDPLSIGKTEVFKYKIGFMGAVNSAQLSIAITGDPLALTGDTGDTAVIWENVVDDDYFNDSESVEVLVFPNTGTTTSFTVGTDVDISGTIDVQGNLALLPTGFIQLQQQTETGWVDVAGYRSNFSALLGLGNVMARLDLTNGPELSPGNYRVTYRVGGVLTSVTIISDVNATLLDEFQMADVPDPVIGNIFDNDVLGSFSPTLAVKNDGSSAFTGVAANDTQIGGDFGTLTISADGSYSYAVRSNLTYSTETREEIFDYQVTHPSGVSETGQLTITIEPDGAGVFMMSSFFSMGDDGDALGMAAMLDEYLGPQEPNEPQNDQSPPEYEPALDPTLPMNGQEDQSYYSAF